MHTPLHWDGSLNLRHALPGLIRSGNLARLSRQGRAQVLAYGLGRIIDLRNRAERAVNPPPFLGRAEYLNLPLLPYRNRAYNEASAAAKSNADHARAMLDHAPNQIVAVLGAILDAPPGPVLIHCHAAVNRTGLIAALCAELAGVSRELIARDHAASAEELVGFYQAEQARSTSAQWGTGQPFVATPGQDMLDALAHLDATWQGVRVYLEAHGLSHDEQTALAERLLTLAVPQSP